MKLLLIIASFFSLNALQSVAQSNNQEPFIIQENGKFGCINDKGQDLIKPIFGNLGLFTEGVSAARLRGYFGFIDASGQWAIPPQFEFASEFHDGAAIVYQNGKHFYINHLGQKLFDASVAHSLKNFDNGLALFTTRSQKLGIWDKTGHLVADTIFSKITPFQNDLAIVERTSIVKNEDGKALQVREVGIINKTGAFIAPFGKYESIETFPNGHFVFDIKNDEKGKMRIQGILDQNGEEIFRHHFTQHQSISTQHFEIRNGYFVVNLYDEENGKNCNCLWSSKYSYEGLMSLKGEIVLDNPLFERIYYFDDTKIVAAKKDWTPTVVDWQGKTIHNTHLIGIRNNKAFENKVEIVADSLTGNKGLIGSDGNWVVKPTFEEEIDATHFSDGFIFFKQNTQDIVENSQEKVRHNDSTEIEYFETVTLWGIADSKGTVLAKPQFIWYDREGFKNGLLSVIFKDHTEGYVNKVGKVVWQQTKNPHTNLDTLNIDYMNRGDYNATSDSQANDGSFGGWAGSSNKAKQGNTNLPPQTFSLQVNLKDTLHLDGKWLSYTVFVANMSTDTLFFEAQDSRLNMAMQAIDSTGQWRNIESLPSSWCGNSYHTLALDPNHFWTFSTPQYKGVFNTRFRLSLEYLSHPNKSKKEDTLRIYSNEWTGSINPSQFWRKKGYSASGIMEAYDE